MAEVAKAKDPAIKLFGRTISLHDASPFSQDSQSMEHGSSMMSNAETDGCRNETKPCKIEQQPQVSIQPSISSQTNSNSKARHEESDDSGEPNSSKRPDKIIPCPRCNSIDTKFCYFNNYNVNQPRHFCKSCQRYWTAGGTVRNVPVGAGRRRNKHLATQYQQIAPGSSDGGGPTTVVETARNHGLSCDEPATSCTGSSPNELVLKFGPETPHRDSVTHRGPLQQSIYHCPPNSTSCGPCGPYLVPGCTTTTTTQSTTPNISVQFVPASYWNYIPVWVAGPGNVPVAVRSGNGLQVLGKHSRETTEVDLSGDGISSSSSSKILKVHDISQP